MSIRSTAAILACKMSQGLVRRLGKGGTATPGKIALKLDPSVLQTLTRGVKVTVVTGTNGKTTTARIIDEAMTRSGLRFLANRSGANLLSGIVTIFSENATATGQCNYDHALIECDEAAFRRAGKFLHAEQILVTNVFRDQLDRYGEISHTISMIEEGIVQSPNATVCLNADDSMTASLGAKLPNKIVYYGLDTPIYPDTKLELSDAPYCIHCKTAYQYDYVTYGHLGGFYCPSCGYRRPKPEVSVTEILERGADSTKVMLKLGEESYPCTINLPGGYNIYNAVSAAAVCRAMGIPNKIIIEALESFHCGFGRMEKVTVGNTAIRMILVKNPTGCNQALQFVENLTEPVTLVFALNDRYADSTDVSWIWDVDYSGLAKLGDNLKNIYVTGIRCDDMAMRLKYDGISVEKLQKVPDYDALFRKLLQEQGDVCILPTYTAMLELRSKLQEFATIKDFWK